MLSLFLIIAPIFLTHAAGASSAQFLSLGAGPRGVAMGEIGSATSEDSYAAYWNPAGLLSLTQPEMALMHHELFEDIEQQFAVYAEPLSLRSAWALSITRLGVSSIESYDKNGAALGSINTSDLSIGLSAAQTLSPSIGLGATVKWIKENLGSASDSAVAADIGLHWQANNAPRGSLWRKIKAGFMINNLGSGLKFDTERFDWPTSIRLGMGYQDVVRRRPTILGFDVSIDRARQTTLSIGGEHWVTRSMALRGGYKTSQDFGSGLRLGFGFKLARVMLDYAWSGFGDIGASHRLGILIRFGPRGQPRYQVIRGPQTETLPSMASAHSQPANDQNRAAHDHEKNTPPKAKAQTPALPQPMDRETGPIRLSSSNAPPKIFRRTEPQRTQNIPAAPINATEQKKSTAPLKRFLWLPLFLIAGRWIILAFWRSRTGKRHRE
ncbi:MAG: PorV/PorQ family protein [Elusimicrobia bacterium]|nr:PorV/PorQ family protein [Elusimicrobiota bacterium]